MATVSEPSYDSDSDAPLLLQKLTMEAMVLGPQALLSAAVNPAAWDALLDKGALKRDTLG